MFQNSQLSLLLLNTLYQAICPLQFVQKNCTNSQRYSLFFNARCAELDVCCMLQSKACDTLQNFGFVEILHVAEVYKETN